MNKTQAPVRKRQPALYAEVDEKLHQAVRIQAARENRKVARLIEDAVTAYLASVEQQAS